MPQNEIDLTHPDYGRRSDDAPTSPEALVMFRDGMSGSGYRQFESLEVALNFIETLRNDANISDMRMFRLEEVEFSFVAT